MENNIPLVSETPNQADNKIRNLWLVIIIFIILFLLAFSGLLLVWQKNSFLTNEFNSQKEQMVLIQNQVGQLQKTETEKEVVQEETVAPSTNWLTHQKEGFQISYPSSWTISESSVSLWLKSKERQALLDANAMARGFDVGVRVYNDASELPNNQEKVSFVNWITNKANDYGIVDITATEVDGVKGYRGVPNIGGIGFVQYVEQNGKIYEIEVDGVETAEKLDVVKSFKFVR